MPTALRLSSIRLGSVTLLAGILAIPVMGLGQQTADLPVALADPVAPLIPVAPAPADAPATPVTPPAPDPVPAPPAPAPEPPAPPAPPAPPEPVPLPTFVVEDAETIAAGEETLKRLSQPMTADLNEVSLRDALAFIADKAGVDVVGDYKTLEAAGVSGDNPVTVKLARPAPAEQILRLVLRAAGGEKVDFAIEGSIVRVADRAALARSVVIRSYDLSAMAGHEDDVLSALTEAVAPDSWRDGSHPDRTGTYRMVGHRLIVGQCEPVHRQIGKFLKLMGK